MSKIFKPRLEAPNKGSKYYDSKNNPFVVSGYGMFQNGGNCTCYAWGRWYELLGKKPKLCLHNAAEWYGYTKDGYKRGKMPKLGAIACWSGGDGAGHVAVVERINSSKDIRTSESGWQSYLFKTVHRDKGYKINSYKFLGFIYPPEEFVLEEEKKTESVEKVEKSVDTLAKEVLAGKWGNGSERRKKLTAAGYNYSKVQARVNQMLYGKK